MIFEYICYFLGIALIVGGGMWVHPGLGMILSGIVFVVTSFSYIMAKMSANTGKTVITDPAHKKELKKWLKKK